MTFNNDTLFNDRNSSYVKKGKSLIDFNGQSGAGYIARGVTQDSLMPRAYKLSMCRINNLGVDKKATLIFTEKENSTNGRIINVSTEVLDNNEMSIEERLNVLYGEVTHESAHVLYTPFAKLKSLDEIHHSLLNILEDERIERKIVDDYVGYADCLESIKEHFFNRLYKNPYAEMKPSDSNIISNFVNLILLVVRYPKNVEKYLNHLEDIALVHDTVDYRDFLTQAVEIMKPYPTTYKAVNEVGIKLLDLIKTFYYQKLKNDFSREAGKGEALNGNNSNKSNNKSTLNDDESGSSNSSSSAREPSSSEKFWDSQEDTTEKSIQKAIEKDLLKGVREAMQKRLDALRGKSEKVQDANAKKIEEEYDEIRSKWLDKAWDEIGAGREKSKAINTVLNSSTVKGGSKLPKHAKQIILSSSLNKYEESNEEMIEKLKNLEDGTHDWRDSDAGTLCSTQSMEVDETDINIDSYINQYKAIKRENKFNIKRLGNALRVQMTSYKDIIKSQRNGKLDKLVDGFIGDEHVYTKQTEGTKEKLSICLLIDESGSMGGVLDDGKSKVSVARNIGIMFNEALKVVDDIELFIYGFDSSYSSDNLYIYKEPTKTKSDYNILRLRQRNGNADYVAIRDSAQKIRSFTKSKCLFIVLSDGLPCHHNGSSYVMKTSSAEEETKLAVDDISKQGFVPMQIGIGTHYETNEMFKDWIQFQNYTQMTTNMVKLIRKRIAKMLTV